MNQKDQHRANIELELFKHCDADQRIRLIELFKKRNQKLFNKIQQLKQKP